MSSSKVDQESSAVQVQRRIQEIMKDRVTIPESTETGQSEQWDHRESSAQGRRVYQDADVRVREQIRKKDPERRTG